MLMGPAVAVPVSREVMQALITVEVTSATSGPSGFQLTFQIDAKSTLNTLLLLLGRIGPVVRVILVLTHKGTPHVLIDGVITHHQLTPAAEVGWSRLTVTGEDLTAAMNQIDCTGVSYPALPAEARVALVLAKYAALGVVPVVIPSLFPDVPVPVERVPQHQGTDLEYVRKLAKDVGYVFYLEPGPAVGASRAYWGPELRVGTPQPALNVNMDGYTNVKTMSFSYEGQSKTLPIVFIQNEETRLPIPTPVPDISPLRPPLGRIPAFPSRVTRLPGTAKLTAPQALALGMAKAAESADVVSASGTVDPLRYGHILKARKLVGLRGAGQAFDGLYFVKTVKHRIKRGDYEQVVDLTRTGLVSTVSRIPT